MSMKIVFLKDYKRMVKFKEAEEFKPLDETFVLRKLGQELCFHEIAIPDYRKEQNPEFQRLVKAKEKAEKKAEKEAEKPDEKKIEALVKGKKTRGRKKAVSKAAEIRETTEG